MAALVRIERPQTVWTIGRLAKVNVGYAQEALPRMADWKPDQGDAVYAVVRRRDLGSDVYQAIEESPGSRSGRHHWPSRANRDVGGRRDFASAAPS
jgi:hypothetical protein